MDTKKSNYTMSLTPPKKKSGKWTCTGAAGRGASTSDLESHDQDHCW